MNAFELFEGRRLDVHFNCFLSLLNLEYLNIEMIDGYSPPICTICF